ncbi:MAG: glutathione S-transferase family protein [Proteobacteria bacterium]|nr:glutathione S-transferase family protein [Pseudomonadota bacterium]HQR02696.1 glutathione S-transferase family protein [Rhodocyclaceae bacterium]
MTTNSLIFFHAPQTRSSGTRFLLEELGAPHEMRVLNLKAGETRRPEYLAINPMGKVPAILDRGVLVTEQPAIFIHLADRFPQAGLAPAIDDPLRGAYLRWMIFYGSSFEPAIVDKHLQRDSGGTQMSPYGSFDEVLKTLTDHLDRGPWMLGERFSAADVLWGTAFNWTVNFKIVPDLPVIRAYIDRVTSRPAFRHTTEDDARLVTAQS